MATQAAEVGVLKFTNCVAVVPQDKYFAVELFGSFRKTLMPGLHWAGIDLCGLCVALRSISNRIEQIKIRVDTKTKDNVFVTACVAVDISVDNEKVDSALYKLADVQAQVDSYVSDIVRSEVPKLELDEAFEQREELAAAIKGEIMDKMSEFGFTVHKALMTELEVAREVMDSMNEISKQARLKEATVMAAEAEKFKVVKAAEAEGEKLALQGDGIARQRSAIVEGIQAAIEAGTNDKMSTEEITTMLLTLQHHETLKQIGDGPYAKAYFLPEEMENDTEGQIRLGILMAKAAQDNSAPVRQEMRTRYQQTRQDSLLDQQAMFAAPQSNPMAQEKPPSPPPPARFQQAPRPAEQGIHQIRVPPGAVPGATLQVKIRGQVVQVKVPPNAGPGTIISVRV